MKRPRQRLTDKGVRALPFAASGQYTIRDTEVRGLMIVVGTGSKSWTVQVDRTAGGRKTMKKKIGDASIMKVVEARRLAMSKIAELRGAQGARAGTGAPVTLAAAWASYETHLAHRVAAGARSIKTLDLYRSLIRNHFASWADMALRDLSAQAKLVAERHREISKRSPGSANQAMRLLRAIYNHADNFDLDKDFGDLPIKNPTRQVVFNKETRRNTGMDPAEMADWNKERLALPSPIQVEFQLLMILSGSRPDALKRARWSDLKRETRTLHFPDPKGGADAKYSIPLSRQMLYCLVRARKAGRMLHWSRAKEFVFPGPGKSGHLWNSQCPGRLSRHGGSLRQTFITSAQAIGIPWADIKILVNHRDSDVTAGYVTAAALAGPLRAHQQRISNYIIAGLQEST